jgi:hypothetical protein
MARTWPVAHDVTPVCGSGGMHGATVTLPGGPGRVVGASRWAWPNSF